VKPPAVTRAEAALGADAESWAHVAGGYTHNERWVVRFADGRSTFVKGAVDEMTTDWLRTEHLVYSTLAGAPFLPRLLAWDDGELPVLVLEDLRTRSGHRRGRSARSTLPTSRSSKSPRPHRRLGSPTWRRCSPATHGRASLKTRRRSCH
jgi:hypothetical protein